jgi:hypothetical protein
VEWVGQQGIRADYEPTVVLYPSPHFSRKNRARNGAPRIFIAFGPMGVQCAVMVMLSLTVGAVYLASPL